MKKKEKSDEENNNLKIYVYKLEEFHSKAEHLFD